MIRLYASFGILTMLMITACVSTADVDFAEVEQELVIYSHFGSGSPNSENTGFSPETKDILKIFLTHTRDPLKPNTPFEPVENAKITVYRDGVSVSSFNRTFDSEKQNMSAACYEAEIEIVSGSHYKIEVDVEGYKVAKAETIVPRHSATMISFDKDSENYRLVFTDNENIENYYQLIVKALKYKLIEGEEMYVDEEVIDYELVDLTDFPHVDTEANKDWMAIYPEYAGFLFASPKRAGNKELLIDISNRQNEDDEHVKYIYRAELHNVSEAYYLYHQSIEVQLNNQNYLTDPSRIYNNIENGFGNFSAYNIAVAETMARRIGD